MTGVGTSFDSMWAALEPVGRHPSPVATAVSPGRRELREWFAGECSVRRLDQVDDTAGNQWGWWGDPDAPAKTGGAAAVVLGSHLDSVPDGGAFDGPLGVVSAFATIDALRSAGHHPRRPIAVSEEASVRGTVADVTAAARHHAATVTEESWTDATLFDHALAEREDCLAGVRALTRVVADLTSEAPA